MTYFKTKKLLAFLIVFFIAANVFYISENTRANDNDFEDYGGVNLTLNISSMPSEFFINKEVIIPVKITNNGLNNTSYGKIDIFMKMEGINISYNSSKKMIEPGENITINLSWNPDSLGYQNLNFSVRYNSTVFDYNMVQILVKPKDLTWWDSNWHYRTFIMTNGSGNVSRFFNFTKIAENLNLNSSVSFENETMRVIQYSQEGEPLDKDVKYNFSETSGFNNTKNATGVLKWNVTGPNSMKYYYIYYDYKGNIGEREEKIEAIFFNISKNIEIINETVYYEGWWHNLISPSEQNYLAYNYSLDITVDTVAKAYNVTGSIKVNGVEKYSVRLENNKKIHWFFNNLLLNETGIWILKISCNDSVGYVTSSEFMFFVDIVDLNVTFHDEFSFDTVHVEDEIELPFIVSSINASVSNVDVSFYVNNEFFGNKTVDVTNKESLPNITLRWISYVDFDWIPYVSKTFDLKIIVDDNNDVCETNESNNHLTFQVEVVDWSDLSIKSFSVSKNYIKPMKNVTFSTTVVNEGKISSKKYVVCFYIKSLDDGFNYNNPVYCTEENNKLAPSEENIFSFEWNASQPDVYIFGVEVKPVVGRDSNYMNNRFVSEGFLSVYEINPPEIKNVLTENVMIGENPEISAEITDESGLKSVKIDIFKSNGAKIVSNANMINKDDLFSYVFRKADETGFYYFEIKAVDNSYAKNFANATGFFRVEKDTEKPVITFFDVKPKVQILDENVLFECSAVDNIKVEKVRLNVERPDGKVKIFDMSLSDVTGYYVSEIDFNQSGYYSSFVTIEDKSGNSLDSKIIGFWVTSDLDDTDDDGMPDWWEDKYGLDPEDSSDAKKDKDKDGYSNLKEYMIGGNPERDIFMQNALYRVEQGFGLIVLAVLMLLFLLVLSIIGFRRGIF